MGTNDGMTLRELREQSGKTRAEVAAMLGVSYQALCHYEQGVRRIGLVHVLMLSRFYLCEAGEFIIALLISCRTARSDSLR